MPITGVDESIKGLEAFAKRDWKDTVKAFEKVIVGEIVPECQRECPVDTGELRASIPLCSGVRQVSEGVIGIVGAGGLAADYALRQHEDLTFHHPALPRQGRLSQATQSAIAKYGSQRSGWFKNVAVAWAPNGTKAKFIEDPVRRAAPTMLERVISYKEVR